MKKKLLIAVSSCLLGHQVRYDGRTKFNPFIIDELSKNFTFKPICPEVGIGLGVPRKPIQLIYRNVRGNGSIQAVQIENSDINYTQQLKDYATQFVVELNDVKGFIFKAKSPSCGVGTTTLHRKFHEELHRKNEENPVENRVNGIFAQAVLTRFPGMPIIDETQLKKENDCLHFLKAVNDYAK